MPIAVLEICFFLALANTDPMTAQAKPNDKKDKLVTTTQTAKPNDSVDEPKVSEQAAMMAEVNAVAREVQKRTRAARESGNILTELESMRSLEEDFSDHGDIARGMLAQMLATLTSRLGNYSDAIRYFDEATGPWKGATKETASLLKDYTPKTALQTLSTVADEAQVIMINEAHHVPEHRAFTLRLLYVLREKGFTHFAAETILETDAGLETRGYPVTTTGTYTSEPVYGDLIRTALRLGYRVVPYESRPNGDPTYDRERGQATHLAERILKKDPKAKILVHAGFSHINESGLLAGNPPMAAQFREITGIDPFTVDQTLMTARSSSKHEHPIYRRVVAEAQVDEPTLFVAKNKIWSLRPGHNDATLFHPPPAYRDGRPLWLRLDGLRSDVRLPKELNATKKHLVAWAKSSKESTEAIPLDLVEIVPNQTLPVLVLPPGEFTIVVEDAAGESVLKFPTTVPSPPKGAAQ